jgi:hypothetical protein
MSRTAFHPRVILSAAVLIAALMGTACSDSTAPATAEGSAGDSPAQSPADSGSPPAGPDVVPNHVSTQPPSLPQLGPGDTTTSSIKPLFYQISADSGSGYAPGPGAMNVSPGAVGCLGGLISLTRSVWVSATSGLSGNYYQYVVGEVFLYRLVGSTWVYQSRTRADVRLPWEAPLAALEQNDPLLASVPGGYRVILRLTWYTWIGGVYVWTASTTVNFVDTSDYIAAVGATVSRGGYCRVS